MFARALLRVARPHLLRAPVAPCSAFLKFCSPSRSHLSRPTGISVCPALSHVALNLNSSSCNFRAFSLFHGCSRPTRPAVSSRGFFSSSDGPRPSLAEVLSIAKLKARLACFPLFSNTAVGIVTRPAAGTLWHLVCWGHCCARDCECYSSWHEKVLLCCSSVALLSPLITCLLLLSALWTCR
jgi:hypothetical protein